MIPHEYWPHWQPFLCHTEMPINNSLQFSCHLVPEISIPMRLRPRQTVGGGLSLKHCGAPLSERQRETFVHKMPPFTKAPHRPRVDETYRVDSRSHKRNTNCPQIQDRLGQHSPPHSDACRRRKIRKERPPIVRPKTETRPTKTLRRRHGWKLSAY